jgi:hypothetical protein
MTLIPGKLVKNNFTIVFFAYFVPVKLINSRLLLRVSPDMLFCRLFIASNPTNLFGNPDCTVEWLKTVDCYRSLYSDLKSRINTIFIQDTSLLSLRV